MIPTRLICFPKRSFWIFFDLFDEAGYIFPLQLSDLESSLLNLSDPQLNNVQQVLDDYDKKVLGELLELYEQKRNRSKKKVKYQTLTDNYKPANVFSTHTGSRRPRIS